MIKVSNIYKNFAGNQVLKGVSATFDTGNTNLIIGQSGSGKTVLLKTIVGLHEANEGQIWYDETLSSDLDFKATKELRKSIGMLFQGGALFDSSTIEDNIKLPLDMFTEMSTEEKIERVNFCLDKVHLTNVNNRFPAEISGGMQKRAAIARAIALNPKYLFCDEPNSGLDPRTAIVIDNLIQEITKEFNITTIINTHDMNSVMEIGEKVIFIHEGNKEWEGDNKDILRSDNKYLNDFVFANKMAQEVRKSFQK